MSNDLIAATTVHLIPTSEALARVSQADLVNLMVVQYKESAGSQIDGILTAQGSGDVVSALTSVLL